MVLCEIPTEIEADNTKMEYGPLSKEKARIRLVDCRQPDKVRGP
jgi:hypothetical protein